MLNTHAQKGGREQKTKARDSQSETGGVLKPKGGSEYFQCIILERLRFDLLFRRISNLSIPRK